jgi:hypothetical protein
MAYTTKPPPLPVATAPIVDPKTGLMNPAWYQWLVKFVAWCVAGFAAIP